VYREQWHELTELAKTRTERNEMRAARHEKTEARKQQQKKRNERYLSSLPQVFMSEKVRPDISW
jgi:hypothetical protein